MYSVDYEYMHQSRRSGRVERGAYPVHHYELGGDASADASALVAVVIRPAGAVATFAFGQVLALSQSFLSLSRGFLAVGQDLLVFWWSIRMSAMTAMASLSAMAVTDFACVPSTERHGSTSH